MLSASFVFIYKHIIEFLKFYNMTFRFRYKWHLGKIVDEFVVKQLEYKAKIMKGSIFDYKN